MRWQREEEQRESIPWLRVTDAETAGDSQELARRFAFQADGRGGGADRGGQADRRTGLTEG
ncbi:MAG TPA: hypothetical protein VD793_10440, partial [Gemmatimonadales bacterium]|nr:hypothetical protein [Gemmatimonadales bacterium]